MWLFTSFGFFSVVRKNKETHLTIRGRAKADLERLRARYLPTMGEITSKAGTDYPYRAVVPHSDLAVAMVRIVMDIDYGNFKDQVAKELGKDRSKLYHGVWSVMAELEKSEKAAQSEKAPQKSNKHALMLPTESLVWNGYTKSSSLVEEAVVERNILSDAAKEGKWNKVEELISKDTRLINSFRLDGSSWYTPIHQAAYNGAPVEVVEKLIRMGAWRTLRTAKNERPIDIARRKKHSHLFGILEPVTVVALTKDVLEKLQRNFHAVINGRVSELIVQNSLRLPELESLTELPEGTVVWFAVPGMYGGFAYKLNIVKKKPVLTSDSWCRISGYSEQTHEITVDGTKLIPQEHYSEFNIYIGNPPRLLEDETP